MNKKTKGKNDEPSVLSPKRILEELDDVRRGLKEIEDRLAELTWRLSVSIIEPRCVSDEDVQPF